MKIDRLLGILTLLLNKETVTAPELAQYFEVSRRTINRDIEDLCRAGIPVVTRQGSGGGIRIMEGYKLDKRLLKREDLASIVAGLRGLDSVSKNKRIALLLDQFNPDKTHPLPVDGEVVVDLASHYKNSLAEKIELIKGAMQGNQRIRFTYYSKTGETLRVIEPYRIIYKWSDWYVFGYCTKRRDFRFFKLNRLCDPEQTGEPFVKKAVTQDKKDFGSHLDDTHQFEAMFHPSVKYKLVESYGRGSFEEVQGKGLHFHGSYTNRDHIVSWILSFGENARVVSPPELVAEIREKVRKLAKLYTNMT